MLKAKWEPAVRELYAEQVVWVYPEQDCNGAYLCEMRSGPRAGLFYWFTESEFMPERTRSDREYTEVGRSQEPRR